ncbi:MAG: hypothetical protein QM731_09630 [Chitinophagaceae bacterium]
MAKLTKLSLYNLRDELVADQLSGTLEQQLNNSIFESYLKLDGTHTNHFKVGERYYAVGVMENQRPVRSETVECKAASPHPVFEGKLKLPEPSKGQKAGPESTGYMSLAYSNYSSTSFDISTNGYYFEPGMGGLTTAPGPVLQATSGLETMSGSQELSTFEHGNAGIYLCWASGYNFGLWINFPIQVLTIGSRPYWYVSYNGGAWTLSSNNPANPYTFPTSAVPWNIVATPTSEHTSLSIQIIITDLNS